MQVANAPLKWLIPWAQQNTNIFELPSTTSDPTRASQGQGFPAETMLPPESGGVPPQGIDFNAGLYQVARITWWLMYGGGFVYDATFATNAAISGYAQGADVSSTDYLGYWLNTTDNNQVSPDTVGTGWVPGYVYGRTSTALTNANVTLTPLQAMKKALVFTGTLTGNVVVTLPAWIYEWNVLNQCSGAFTLTLTTSGGSGAVAPQGGATKMRGDGTNINYDQVNVPTATTSTAALSLGQATGRLLRTTIYSVVAGSQQVSVNGGAFTTTGATTFSSQALTTLTKVKVLGAGGGGGGAAATGASQSSAAGGGAAGGYTEAILLGPQTALTVTVTSGGAGGAAGLTSGLPGGTTVFGPLSATGGGGGSPGATASSWPVLAGAGAGGQGSGGLILNAKGASGGIAVNFSVSSFASGVGGTSPYGGGGASVGNTSNGSAAVSPGAGGSGGGSLASNAAGAAGGAGAGGYVEVEEYC